jgi:hypothetical protein
MVENKNKKGKKAIWPETIISNENLEIGESCQVNLRYTFHNHGQGG